MPKLSQGDIFEAASRVQLAIVFGHVGFNEMGLHWFKFAARKSQLTYVRDPFAEIANRAVEWFPGRWLWFVAEQKNHGMTEMQLIAALDAALLWASQNAIVSIATNGIANINHGHKTEDNRRSDDQRVDVLIDYAKSAVNRGFTIELISLSDAFTRSRQ